MWNGDMVQYLEKTGHARGHHLPERRPEDAADDRPGTRWEYGTNIDFVGKAVEAVSGNGSTLICATIVHAARHDRHRLKIGDSQRKRLVGMHARGEDGSLAPIRSSSSRNRNSTWVAAASTAPRVTTSNSPK